MIEPSIIASNHRLQRSHNETIHDVSVSDAGVLDPLILSLNNKLDITLQQRQSCGIIYAESSELSWYPYQ